MQYFCFLQIDLPLADVCCIVPELGGLYSFVLSILHNSLFKIKSFWIKDLQYTLI
jgi:hypothetical protein